jgi:flagellar motor switch protein FliN/FliY
MNAIPPKGQMPQPENPGHPQGDPIHLTMSFEDDMPAETDFADADQPGQAEAPGSRSAAEQSPPTRPGAGQAQPDPAAATGSQGPTRPVRGALPPQFAGIELALTVEVGGLNIALRDLMSVEPGQLLALDRMTSEPVSVLVNGKPFARGEIVAIGDRYGVRLLEIVPATEIGG